MNKLKMILNWKTAFRLGVVIYWLSVVFVTPYNLLFLIPYGFYRLHASMFGDTRYWDFKKRLYAKSDVRLTFRKMAYYIEEASRYDLNEAKSYTSFDVDEKTFAIRIDEFNKVYMKYDAKEKKYYATLSFQGKRVDLARGAGYNVIRWDLEQYPAIEKALTRFEKKFEAAIQEKRVELKKTREKKDFENKKATIHAKKQLAKEVREAYKKGSL